MTLAVLCNVFYKGMYLIRSREGLWVLSDMSIPGTLSLRPNQLSSPPACPHTSSTCQGMKLRWARTLAALLVSSFSCTRACRMV